MKKMICLVLVMLLLAGCGTVADIAANVLNAAKDELVAQVQQTVEQYRLTVREIRPLVGKLNDDGGKYQFFCAVLVQTNNADGAGDCAGALGKVFGEGGYQPQSDPSVQSNRLVHKRITYSHTDYSEGNYYTVYVYTRDLTKIIDLDAIAEKLRQATAA